MIRRLALAAAVLAAVFLGLSVDLRYGDLRYEIAGHTLRHFSWVPAAALWKPACADFADTGGWPCGANATATNYTLAGPAAGSINLATGNFTAQAVGTLGSSVTVTPSDNGHGGVFSPTSCTLAAGTGTSCTFTYTPLQAGSWNIQTSNNGGLSDPAVIAFSVANLLPGYPGFTSGWTTGDTTLATGGANDPFSGSNTATITEDTATNFHVIHSSSFSINSGQSYTGSLMVKDGSGTRNALINILGEGPNGEQLKAIFNPSTCTFVQDNSINGATLTSHAQRTANLANSFCLIQITGTVGTSTSAHVDMVMINSTSDNYLGDGSSSLLIYGGAMQ